MILAVAKEALLEHPDSRVRSLQDLEAFLQVRLVVGAPPRTGPADPDGVGLVDWQVAIYSNGLAMALEFIEFIVNYKVRKGILATKPDFLAHVMDLGSGPLPSPWQKLEDDTLKLPHLFSAMPPRGRRHVLAQLELQPEQELTDQGGDNIDANQKGEEGEGSKEDHQDLTYILAFYGNLYPFKDRFESNDIPGAFIAINASERPEYVRYVKFNGESDSMQKVLLVLQNILKNMPVYFINMTGESDGMAAWLRQQPSIFPAESLVPAKS